MRQLKTILTIFIALTFLMKLHCDTKIAKITNNSNTPVQIRLSKRAKKGPPPSAKEMKKYLPEIEVLKNIKPKTTVMIKKGISVPIYPKGSLIIKTKVGDPLTGRHFLFIMKEETGYKLMVKRLRKEKEEPWGDATPPSGEIQNLSITINEDYSITIEEIKE